MGTLGASPQAVARSKLRPKAMTIVGQSNLPGIAHPPFKLPFRPQTLAKSIKQKRHDPIVYRH